MKDQKKVYIILGLPGAGKGVCAQELQKKYNFLHFSLGDYLREAVQKQSTLGTKFHREIIEGQVLLPCKLVFWIIKQQINTSAKNIIIDGYPRTIAQLKYLDNYIKNKNIVLNYVWLNVDPQLGVTRLLTRKHCVTCKYDFIMVKTLTDGRCDFCNSTLYVRETDNADDLRRRIDMFYKTTQKVIEHLQNTKSLITIDANKCLNVLKEEFLQLVSDGCR